MPEKEDYKIENIYGGGYSSFSPSYGNIFTGYHVAASELGAPTKPDTANQIQQVSMLLNQGIIPIEVGALQPEVFDQIPKQHFKEINRMAKLAGAKISVHAPIIEPSGITEQGWNEANRELAERQLNNVVEKSIEMDDKGGMPITVHCSGLPGKEYKKTLEGKEVERIIVVEKETGKPVQAIEEETLFYPGEDLEKGRLLSPEKRVDNINKTHWDNSLSQLIFNKERADEILQQNQIQIQHLMKGITEGTITGKTLEKEPDQMQAYTHLKNAEAYLDDTYTHVNALFDKAYKYGSPEQKEILKQFSEKFKEDLGEHPSIMRQSQAVQNLLLNLKNPVLAPKFYEPIEEFAVDKSAKTFANVAFNAFDKFKDKAPIISIENMYPGMAFGSAEELNKLVKKSREEFVNQAVKKGYSKSTAEKQAEKMIGVTLDVGHLNIAKRKGFTDEDLRKEAEQIAKHVKHVHLTDNFGYSDSHLPPGMGNVPIKKILEELEKKGVDVKKLRKVVEAGGFVQHFGTSPFPSTLEAMGSPIYSMHMAPYWNQAIGLQQSYMGGYGMMLPQINYQTFGAGFAQLPTELGGQMPGAQGSRMSGTPME